MAICKSKGNPLFIEIKSYIRRLNSGRQFKAGYCHQVLLIGLLLLPLHSVLADDDALNSFNASYKVFKGDKQIGEATLKVEKTLARVRWQMTTIPGGLYALITSKKPYSESIMRRSKGDYRLSSVKISTDIKDTPEETAVFNWRQSKMTAARKNKQVNLSIKNDAYDYLSIHWLSAQMSLAQANRYDLVFYRKGKLMNSTLTRTGTEALDIDGKTVNTTVFEQSFEGSSRRLTYHYDLKNPWLPIRIERNKKGKKPTILLLSTAPTL